MHTILTLPEGINRDQVSWLTDIGGVLVDSRLGTSVIYKGKEDRDWQFGMLLEVSQTRGYFFLERFIPLDNYDQREAVVLDNSGHKIRVPVTPKGAPPTILVIN